MDGRSIRDHRDGELSGNLIPLTGAQANVWFHQQLDPSSVAYNVGQYIEIDGVIEPERMARALQSVVDGFEALRLRFVACDGVPFQEVLAPGPVAMEQYNLRLEADPRAAARTLLWERLRQPFNVEFGPCVRFGLIRRGERDWVFFQVAHHLVNDGSSVAVFVRSLADAYRDDDGRLREEPVSWTAAVEADSAYLQGASFDIDRRYWEAELEGLEAPVSLSTRELQEVEVPFPESTSIELSREAYEGLVDFGRLAGGSTIAPFAAAVLIYLSRLTGCLDVCLGMPTSGRTQKTRALSGLFTV
jgi:hypothetical protein